MAGGRHGGRRRGAHEPENEERWLLTYADMITLLLALFMVLFSISSVNISKYRTLQKALKDAFSGQVLPGGRALENTGVSEKSAHAPETTATTAVVPFGLESASPAHNPGQPRFASEQPSASEEGTVKALESVPGARRAAAQQEQASFQRLQHEVQAFVAAHGLQSSVNTLIEPRGLVIRILTDKLLFASGQATLSPAGYPLLDEVAGLLGIDHVHPIAVEGNTDDVPIDTPQFPSNWELSTARADTIVRFLASRGVAESRLSAVGFGEQRPIASNATEAGRALNRRVDVVFERLYPQPSSGESSAEALTETGLAEAQAQSSGPSSPATGAHAASAAGAGARLGGSAGAPTAAGGTEAASGGAQATTRAASAPAGALGEVNLSEATPTTGGG